MDREHRLKRLRFRAWHRGTKEADLLIGGFFDKHHAGWDDAAIDWFAALIEEDDIDVMAWAIGTQQPPPRYEGAMMGAMRKLDYVAVPR